MVVIDLVPHSDLEAATVTDLTARPASASIRLVIGQYPGKVVGLTAVLFWRMIL